MDRFGHRLTRSDNCWVFPAFGLLTAVSLLCGMLTGYAAPIGEPPYSKTNLIEFLAGWKPVPADRESIYQLEPDWVGTIRRVYLRDFVKIYKEEAPEDIRFSHLAIWRHQNPETDVTILRGRLKPDGKLGSYVASEAPIFKTSLPSARTVSAARNLDDLLKMLGPQRGWTSGWGGPDRMHWTASWTAFAIEGKRRLRYLNVFAHVSRTDKKELADIDILVVREGFFRPANPKSDEERVRFKTGGEMHVEYEAGRAKARAKYPLPLRSLVEARETPDDSGLSAYKRALNDARRKPSPELFRQFAEWVDEGTCEIRGILEKLLFDSKLNQWEAPKRKDALRALVEALPSVKTSSALDDLIIFILQAQGGGELSLQIPGTEALINIKADRFPDGTGASFRLSGGASTENLPAAAKECQRLLREQYAELR